MIVDLAELFYNCDWKLKRKTHFVALKTDDFSFLKGYIATSDGGHIKKADYLVHPLVSRQLILNGLLPD